jgi:hypothetical protein
VIVQQQDVLCTQHGDRVSVFVVVGDLAGMLDLLLFRPDIGV